MYRIFIFRAVIAIFCIIACATQTSAAESTYSVAGRLDVPSLMKLSENFSKIGDKIAPGMGNSMVMLTVGLSMNPEFCDFDMSAPLSFILLADSADPEQKEMNICIFAMKKRRTVQPSVKIGGETFMTKDLGEYAAVCSTKKLADKFDFTGIAMPPKEGIGTLMLSLDMRNAMKNFSFASFMMSRIYGKDPSGDGMPSEKELNEMKESKLIFDRVDSLLKQFDSLKLTLAPNKNNVVITLNAKAAGKSYFESFIKAQKKGSMRVPETVFEGAETFAVMSITPSDELKKSVADMFAEMSLETTEGTESEAKSHSGFYEALFKAADGNAWLSAGIKNGAYLSKSAIGIDKAKQPELQKIIEKKEKTPFDGTWLLEKNKGNENALFCTLDKKNPTQTVFFTAPMDTPDGFFMMLSDKNATKMPKLKTGDASIALFNLKRLQGNPGNTTELEPFLTVRFDRSPDTMFLELMIDPADFATTPPLFNQGKKTTGPQKIPLPR